LEVVKNEIASKAAKISYWQETANQAFIKQDTIELL
jgi:hypothetical protein